jgi:hypothetical protein
LATFSTTLQEDLDILKSNKRKDLNIRQYFAVLYRSEQKKMLNNQIRLVNIVIHILERLMKGMTLDFAVTRIFELESKKDMPLNRKMINSYLESLRRGLEKNKQDYLKQNNLTEEQLRLQYAEKRFVEGANNSELR